MDRAAARQQVKGGKQTAAAKFPQGFGEQSTYSLFTGDNKPQVELLVDPSQTTGARVIEGLLAQYSMQEISKEAFTGVDPTPLRDDLRAPRIGDARRCCCSGVQRPVCWWRSGVSAGRNDLGAKESPGSTGE